METATELTELHPSPHQRMQFSEEIAMAARLFIAMIRNCNYDEPIDFDHIESDLEQTSGSEALPHSSGELAGSKRRANGTNAHPKKRTRKTTSGRTAKKPIAKNTLVAAYIKLEESGDFEWVMSKVTGYTTETKMYTVVDTDGDEVGSKGKKYKVVRKDIRIISDSPNRSRPKNSRVLAVYPETSVFYPAVVKSTLKKRGSDIYLLEFEGEEEPGEAMQVEAKLVIDMERR